MTNNAENFERWSEEELATYLQNEAGLGNYHEVLVKHKVTGEVAPRLTEGDLREMGIESVGDRKRFQKALSTLQKEHRKIQREQVIWEDQELLFWGCWDQCMSTCCGCCPADPSHYKLTGTHLIITTEHPCRLGPITCCCGAEYTVDNLDLTHITDADVKGKQPPCTQKTLCCAKAQDHIIIASSDGQKILKLHKGEGGVVSRKILNQVEEAQKIERD